MRTQVHAILVLVSLLCVTSRLASQVVWERQDLVLPRGGEGAWDSWEVYAPSVVRFHGEYWLWYNGSEAPGFFNHSIGCARSKDLLSWEKCGENRVFVPELPWEGAGVGHPSVIAFGEQLMMWYWGQVNNECHIGLATSEDGRNWSRQEEPVFRSESPPSWEFSCIGGQTVLFNPVRREFECRRAA